MTEIMTHKLVEVKVNDLEFDPENPNEMTREQMGGLRESMKKWGFLEPIIIDQNNKIVDGEHRALVYKEFGKETIPAYQLNLTNEIERRLLRQVKNKNRGTHDPLKDSSELQKIFEGEKLGELALLIGQNEEEFKEALGLNREVSNIIEDDIKQNKEKYNITFKFGSLDQYELVLGALKELDEEKEMALIKLVNNQNGKQE